MKKLILLSLIITSTYVSFGSEPCTGYLEVKCVIDYVKHTCYVVCSGCGKNECKGPIKLNNNGLEVDRAIVEDAIRTILLNGGQPSTINFPLYTIYVSFASLDENGKLEYIYTASENE